jgi:hypothetical protein
LVGVLGFELTQIRPLLLIFPNTFEYFFDFYEGVRLRWDPRRMSKRLVIGAAAFIWIVIKLPQEYIIHVAQVDTTDWIKNNIFGVSADASWGEAIANAPGVTVLLVVLVLALIVAAWWIVTRRLPPADRKLRLAADPIPPDVAARARAYATTARPLRLTDPALIEKVILVSLVSVIFAQMLPGTEAGVIAISVGVAFVVAVNASLSTWLARQGLTWATTARQFAALAGANTLLILLYAAVLPGVNGSLEIGHALFFALLLTLIITMFDRYQPLYVARFDAVPADGDLLRGGSPGADADRRSHVATT